MIAATVTGFRHQVFLQSKCYIKNVKYKFFHVKIIKTRQITVISLSVVFSVDFFSNTCLSVLDLKSILSMIQFQFYFPFERLFLVYCKTAMCLSVFSIRMEWFLSHTFKELQQNKIMQEFLRSRLQSSFLVVVYLQIQKNRFFYQSDMKEFSAFLLLVACNMKDVKWIK